VDIDRADRSALLRVPGIGPRTARAILEARRNGARIRSVEDLRRAGVPVNRAAEFILINGKKPLQQMRLF
jgi:predicted DNA-binding helix-hairpin-helix protein